jgi:hypothetical protein
MPPLDAPTTLTQQLRALETVPDSYLVVSPDLVILTASNAYLADTLKRREDLVGRYLFDAFPDNPAAPEAYAVRNWRASWSSSSPRASPTRWRRNTTTCSTRSGRATS